MPTAAHPAAVSTFVPQNLNAWNLAELTALMDTLQSRPVRSVPELERWIEDRSELSAAISEARATLYIAMTCDTGDAEAAGAYKSFVENVEPSLKPRFFELDKKLMACAEQFPLPDRYAVLTRSTRAGVEIYREENVPLETELALLGQKFEETAGAMTVQFEGQERTLPQMSRYQELPDRAVRESAWRTVAQRRLQDRETFNAIYDEMIALRTKVARNAGFESYVGYTFKAMNRFDYSPRECAAFHDAVERAVVPLCRAIEKRRARDLGLTAKNEPLRPWDLSVDPKGRGPLKPFENGKEMMDRSVAAMRSLDPRLGTMLASLGTGAEAKGCRDGASLDLDSRKGKAPGGYQYMRDRSRRPFIFMNAAGLHSDLVTMVHEAGHAFHSLLCNEEPLVEYRHSPTEFAEVASMSMELLTMNHWAAKGSFYEGKPQDHRRACFEQMKRSISLLPWIATIDAFQHFVYGHPTHTRSERTTYWLGLDSRFGAAVSWEGIEDVRGSLWQRQLHLFGHPFYYIEYGIAQLGALQLWLIALEKGESAAIDLYMRGLSLGGSKPLPQLFEASGLKFDFGYDTVARLTERVQKEFERVAD
jgi:oligoendopeptidase F